MLFDILLFVLGVLMGGTAAIVGFGVGSFLTPVLALRTGFSIAVAAVAIAHFCSALVRYWMLRGNVNRRILLSFGALSAAGGLAGALLQGQSSSAVLSAVFGGLLIFAGISELFHWTEKIRLEGRAAWVIGALSGFFGGLVGNQGGLRAVGLVGFRIKKTEFVATATAIALVVDAFRVPVYVVVHAQQLPGYTLEITVMSLGAIIGTIVGAPILRHLPERYFKIALSVSLIGVGALALIGFD